MSNQATTAKPPFIARMIRLLAVPIIIGWLVIAYVLSAVVPPLEQVEKEHSVSLIPNDAPSFEAIQRMGVNFGEATSNSVAIIVLEGDQPLGDEAHRYYNDLVRQLKADPAHVQHVQDFWGIRSPQAQRKAPTTRLCTSRWGWRVTWAKHCRTSPWKQSGASSTGVRHPRASKPMSPGPAAIVADLSASGNRTVLLVTGPEPRGHPGDAPVLLPLDLHGGDPASPGGNPITGGARGRRAPRRSGLHRPVHLCRQSFW